jgi:hypothetical protein
MSALRDVGTGVYGAVAPTAVGQRGLASVVWFRSVLTTESLDGLRMKPIPRRPPRAPLMCRSTTSVRRCNGVTGTASAVRRLRA